jgi:ssDNA-binding Zn-finger/Zn-ribbon topoisomerase 1
MEVEVRCPECGAKTSIRTIVKESQGSGIFHVCNHYPECKGTIPISLDDVYRELESLDVKSEIQYKHTLYFAGATVGISVTLVGASMWATATLSSDWQITNAVGVMIIGFVFFMYCVALNDKLRKKRARRGKSL